MKTPPVQVPRSIPPTEPTNRSTLDSDGFAEALARAGLTAATTHAQANRAVESFTRGDGPSIHDTLLAMEKADISLRYMVSVRDRLLDAYREVMRMGM
jgi:flagellar hook-basal body complex protein FliE